VADNLQLLKGEFGEEHPILVSNLPSIPLHHGYWFYALSNVTIEKEIKKRKIGVVLATPESAAERGHLFERYIL
jgi:hypothetical protein